ncbi:hypothetical protein CBR_g12194 [Chara braunii]|uniref:Uncharacterized protein n=1 Tax=Chara braunii TaxID=69332 RepID=A0A388KRC6_CHABU|nr:hypothetical protein CBR_g12194 [Chara braunii]|eukprot:GBG72621.1 hypothetical protein CBR_g12194 [Chara braunii]
MGRGYGGWLWRVTGLVVVVIMLCMMGKEAQMANAQALEADMSNFVGMRTFQDLERGENGLEFAASHRRRLYEASGYSWMDRAYRQQRPYGGGYYGNGPYGARNNYGYGRRYF